MDNDDQHYLQSLKKLSVQKLKKTARKLSISSEGNKQDLIDRIMKKASIPSSDKSHSPPISEHDEKDNATEMYSKEQLHKLSSSDLLEVIKRTFTRTELIESILRRQKRYQVDDSLKARNEKTTGNKIWNNAHERNIAPVAFGERMATDYDKIAKERERIRELKKKRKGQNDLRSRNQQAKANNLWSSPHEKVVKVKELKQPKPKKKKKGGDNRDKIADPVSREINEKREEVKTNMDHEEEDNDDDNDDDDHEENEHDKEDSPDSDGDGSGHEELDEDDQDEEEQQGDDTTANHANASSGFLDDVASPAPHRAAADDDDDGDDENKGDAQGQTEEAEYY